MNGELTKINDVQGVRGSFIWDNRDEVIASTLQSTLDTVTLRNIGREVNLTMIALKTAGEVMNELDLIYEGKRLVARELANAVLIVLCDPQVEIALLRLTLNVVATSLERIKRVRS